MCVCQPSRHFVTPRSARIAADECVGLFVAGGGDNDPREQGRLDARGRRAAEVP
jgi:hypothetical protein